MGTQASASILGLGLVVGVSARLQPTSSSAALATRGPTLPGGLIESLGAGDWQPARPI